MSKLLTESVANANSGEPDHLCVADFYLDLDHDPVPVQRALEEVALTSAYRGLDRPATVVAQEELLATRYRVKAYPYDGADQVSFVTDMTLRGKRALPELGARPARMNEASVVPLGGPRRATVKVSQLARQGHRPHRRAPNGAQAAC